MTKTGVHINTNSISMISCLQRDFAYKGGGGGGGTCYVDLTGGCAAPKGHFLSPDSLAKGVFLAKIP